MFRSATRYNVLLRILPCCIRSAYGSSIAVLNLFKSELLRWRGMNPPLESGEQRAALHSSIRLVAQMRSRNALFLLGCGPEFTKVYVSAVGRLRRQCDEVMAGGFVS